MVIRRTAACLVLVAAGLAGFAAIPNGALAQTVPPPPPAPVTTPVFTDGAPVPVISPTSGPPGTVITVTIPGCTGFVSAAFGNADVGILDFNVSDGDTTTVTVPADTAPGSYIVAAGCDIYTENDVNGAEFTVTPAPVVASPHLAG